MAADLVFTRSAVVLGDRKNEFMTTISCTVITGIFTMAGVIITTMSSNHKIQQQLSTNQAVTDVKIDNLTEEVRKHNNFAQRIPVIEEQIKVANHRIDDLEDEIKTIKERSA